MFRPRGRSLEGTRPVCEVPHGHWKATPLPAALRVTGLTAPLVIDGVINGVLFRGCVEQHLAPTLRPGDIVIMDNLASHKVGGIRSAIEKVGRKSRTCRRTVPTLTRSRQSFRSSNGS